MFFFGNSMRPSMVNSLVDSFFECKKYQVKQRLRDSMETIVDELFDELIGQVKEMLGQEEKGEIRTLINSPVSMEATSVKKKMPVDGKAKSSVKSPPRVNGHFAANSLSESSSAKRPRDSDLATSSKGNFAEIEETSNCFVKKLKIEEIDQEKIGQDEENQAEYPSQNGDQNTPQNQAPSSVASNPAPGKYVCSAPNCGKRFKKSTDLSKHERTHSGAKPYRCTYPDCSYASGDQSNAIKHIKKNHLRETSQGDDPGGSPADYKLYLMVDQSLL